MVKADGQTGNWELADRYADKTEGQAEHLASPTTRNLLPKRPFLSSEYEQICVDECNLQLALHTDLGVPPV